MPSGCSMHMQRPPRWGSHTGSDFMKLIFNCAHERIVRCFGASFSLKLGRVIIKIPRYLME